MALSEAQRRANEKYIKEHYRQVKLSMPNEEADALEEHCKRFNVSKAGFIRQAIREKINRDNDLGEIPEERKGNLAVFDIQVSDRTGDGSGEYRGA